MALLSTPRIVGGGGGGGGGGMAIGSPVTGGSPNLVLYIDPSGDLGQDSLFSRNQTTEEFSVAGALGADPFAISSLSLGSVLGGAATGSAVSYDDATNSEYAIWFAGDATASLAEPTALIGTSSDGTTTSTLLLVPSATNLSYEDTGTSFMTSLGMNSTDGFTISEYSFFTAAQRKIFDFITSASGENFVIGADNNGVFTTGVRNWVFGSRNGMTSGSDNTTIGFDAMESITTGSRNTSLGSLAGKEVLQGNDNTMIGYNTGVVIQNGENNIFIGSNAGNNTSTTINDNVVVGTAAAQNLATHEIVAIGNNALQALDTALQVTAVGHDAGLLSTGDKNNLFGHSSGVSLTTGEENVLIGNDSGRLIEVGSRNVIIGSEAATSSGTTGLLSDNVIIGRQAGSSLGASSGGTGNIILGTNAGSSINANYNIAIGFQTMTASTASANIAIGVSALASNTSGTNIAIGDSAGDDITTGTGNVLMGSIAGTGLITTSSHNTMIGYQSGSQNGGNQNTFFGSRSGEAPLGDNNTAIGYLALATLGLPAQSLADNVAIGSAAMQDPRTGADNNTAIGTNALNVLSTGAGNVALGRGAGGSITTGSRNVFIGTASDGLNTASDQIAIGNGATTTAANQLVIGSSTSPINDYFFGEGVTTVSPSVVIFNASGASGTDIAGADYIFGTGKATGNAIGGNYKVQTSVPGASGTTLQTLGDRNVILAKYVTLTETTATSVARVAIPSGTVAGGTILITVEANDATDYQARTIEAQWSAVNKAGTITTGLSVPVESIAASAGTLTCTLTAVDAGGGNMDFDVDCTSSLTQTTLRASAQVQKNFGTGAITAQ